jgi:hypothetical protein
MLTELVESILQGALQAKGASAAKSKTGRLVIGMLIIILAIIGSIVLWSSSGPKQIEDLTSKRISYRSSYLKGDKHDQQIVLEDASQKYWILCKFWRNQDQAWELMEKLNSTSEAVIYIWRESPRGVTIWRMTTPLKLDPISSIAWSKSNDRAGKWLIGVIYAIGIGFVVSGFCGKKSA